jgi:RNA polymerase sigma-70 factor (ECF subfamily)
MSESDSSPAVVEALVENHRAFRGFLERRVGSRAQAEDILQAAFVRAIEKSGSIRDTESAVAWFYRLLRNALVDHYRRSGMEARLFPTQATEDSAVYATEIRGEICACIRRLLPALKRDYAEIIERVDLKEEPLVGVANALGITPNNAAVRLHRARARLKKQLELSCGSCATHGCLDCGCDEPAGKREGAT